MQNTVHDFMYLVAVDVVAGILLYILSHVLDKM